MWLVALAVAATFAITTMPAPLYAIYQTRFALSPIATTSIFGAYACASLLLLVTTGHLSDQGGRRRVMLVAMLVAGIALLIFASATNVWGLAVARIVSGVAIGLGASAGTSWISELEPHGNHDAASSLMAASILAGKAIGAMCSGAVAAIGPAPLRLGFLVAFAILAGAALLASRVRETVPHVHRLLRSHWASTFGIPRGRWAEFFPPLVTAFAVFSLIGFDSAIMPRLLSRVMHQNDPAVAGAVVAEFFGAAVLAIATGKRLDGGRAMFIGLLLLFPSLALLLLARFADRLSLLVFAVALAGGATGLGYRGSLQVVNQRAPAERRAAVLAVYLIFGSAGLALPVLGIGVLLQFANAALADIGFAIVIALLAVIALIVRRENRTLAS